MTFDEIRKMLLSLPGVEEHQVFGSPTFRIGKRFLACIAKIDADTLVLKVPNPLAREHLLTNHPDIYYLTEHYANFEAALVRMPRVDQEQLSELIEEAWHTFAPKRLVANHRQIQ